MKAHREIGDPRADIAVKLEADSTAHRHEVAHGGQ